MKTKDFDYHLPEKLIAQKPLENRSESRLMLVSRDSYDIEHDRFYNLAAHLKKDDVLVLNDSKVIPARLYGTKEETGASIEILLLEKDHDDPERWQVLAKPARRVKKGTALTFGGGLLKAECVDVGEEGIRDFKLTHEGPLSDVLDVLGTMPLPPYIYETLDEQDRYQTIYSNTPGSSAAPTAGLHFTSDLLESIEARGVEIVHVTLHVGVGTFRPVKVDDVEKHTMHEEFYHLSGETASVLQRAKEEQRRIVAVGTTSTRTLESVMKKHGRFQEDSGYTDIFIYPGHQYQAIDGLITNFHLPQSTLLMMVSAFASKSIILHAYEKAIENKYRFFSFGDAMFIR